LVRAVLRRCLGPLALRLRLRGLGLLGLLAGLVVLAPLLGLSLALLGLAVLELPGLLGLLLLGLLAPGLQILGLCRPLSRLLGRLLSLLDLLLALCRLLSLLGRLVLALWLLARGVLVLGLWRLLLVWLLGKLLSRGRLAPTLGLASWLSPRLLELLARLRQRVLRLLELLLSQLLLGLGGLLHPFHPFLGQLFGLFGRLLEELDVVLQTLLCQIEILSLRPVAHLDPVLEHLGHPFLEVNHLIERQVGGLPHCLHTLD